MVAARRKTTGHRAQEGTGVVRGATGAGIARVSMEKKDQRRGRRQEATGEDERDSNTYLVCKDKRQEGLRTGIEKKRKRTSQTTEMLLFFLLQSVEWRRVWKNGTDQGVPYAKFLPSVADGSR
jgi:hypothetical protein